MLKCIGGYDKLFGMKKFYLLALVAVSSLLGGCGLVKEASLDKAEPNLLAFGQDLKFFSLNKTDVLILGEGDSLIAVSPKYQGRILTSTFGGVEGPSLGWINHELLADNKIGLQTYQVGGEDRFWVGPQGGDYSIFFPQGTAYSTENWRAPAGLSLDPWKLVASSKTQAKFEKNADFENAKGQRFVVRAEREITVLNRSQVSEILGIEIPSTVKLVAFQSFNKLTNLGKSKWDIKSGMLNISVQSCFNANKRVRVFIPYKPGEVSQLGEIVRDSMLDASASGDGRLLVDPSYICFNTDGKKMSGIGVSGKRSEGIVLSYDAKNNLLTVILYIKPADSNRAYLRNSWRGKGSRFDGDAISVYNNGPLAKTSVEADPFYEISTHSPALSLDAGKSQFHIQRTFHFSGSEYDLGLISYKLTGIAIGQLRGDN